MKRILISNFNTNPVSRVAEMFYSSTKFHSTTIQNLQFGQRLHVLKTFSAGKLGTECFYAIFRIYWSVVGPAESHSLLKNLIKFDIWSVFVNRCQDWNSTALVRCLHSERVSFCCIDFLQNHDPELQLLFMKCFNPIIDYWEYNRTILNAFHAKK